MREGVVWQDALPPLLVSLADYLVTDCECTISLTYVKHIACSDLHARKLCERTICVHHHAMMPCQPVSEHAICAQHDAMMPFGPAPGPPVRITTNTEVVEQPTAVETDPQRPRDTNVNWLGTYTECRVACSNISFMIVVNYVPCNSTLCTEGS